jgi:hypothetical protein
MSPKVLTPHPESTDKPPQDVTGFASKENQLIRLLKQISDKDQQITDMQGQLAEQQGMSREIERLVRQVTEILEKNSRLEKALETAGQSAFLGKHRTQTLQQTEEMLSDAFKLRTRLHKDLADSKRELSLAEQQLTEEVKLRLKSEQREEVTAFLLKTTRRKLKAALTELSDKAMEASKENDTLREELAAAVSTLQSCHDELEILPTSHHKLKGLEDQLKVRSMQSLTQQLMDERQVSAGLSKDLTDLQSKFKSLQRRAGGADPEAYLVNLALSVDSLETHGRRVLDQLQEQQRIARAADQRTRRLTSATKANLEILPEWLITDFFNATGFQGEFIGVGVDQQRHWERLAQAVKHVHSATLARLTEQYATLTELSTALYKTSTQVSSCVSRASPAEKREQLGEKPRAYKLIQGKVSSQSQRIEELEGRVMLVTRQNEQLSYTLSQVKAVLKSIGQGKDK